MKTLLTVLVGFVSLCSFAATPPQPDVKDIPLEKIEGMYRYESSVKKADESGIVVTIKRDDGLCIDFDEDVFGDFVLNGIRSFTVTVTTSRVAATDQEVIEVRIVGKARVEGKVQNVYEKNVLRDAKDRTFLRWKEAKKSSKDSAYQEVIIT
jgi:hypothetical protein